VPAPGIGRHERPVDRGEGRLITVVATLLCLVAALVVLTACGPDDDFARECHAKGYVVHEDRHSRSCVPPPQPQPLGWQ
jgi:hypothetical protein